MGPPRATRGFLASLRTAPRGSSATASSLPTICFTNGVRHRYAPGRLSRFARVLRTGPPRATITCLDLACYRRIIARERGELRRSGIRTGFLASLRTAPRGSSTRRRGEFLTIKMPSWQGYYFIQLFWKFNVSCEGGKTYGFFAVFFSYFIKGLIA